jgi:hypothetical protein
MLCSSLLSGDAIDQEIVEYQRQRDAAKLKADLAGRNADRVMQQDWMEYRKELQRQEALEQQVIELDAKIAELEKRKASSKKES